LKSIKHFPEGISKSNSILAGIGVDTVLDLEEEEAEEEDRIILYFSLL
jgi:hypothetical protein